MSGSAEQFGPESFDPELKTEGLTAEGLTVEASDFEPLRASTENRREGYVVRASRQMEEQTAQGISIDIPIRGMHCA
ncbi:MAG: hypothetical protein ACREJJ_08475, partial [Candidatus Methylomirabilales bacterium]